MARRREYGNRKIDYDVYPNGIYILHVNGKLYKSTDWSTTNNSKAVGVALKTSSCRFVIAKEEFSSKWGATGLVSGVPAFEGDYNNSRKDYSGCNSTDLIVAFQGSNPNAAKICKEYTFQNSQKGYLAACGEFYEAFLNKAEVNSCMSKIGGTPLSETSSYWTTTQWHSVSAWALDWKSTGNWGSPKSSVFLTRPFAKFPS